MSLLDELRARMTQMGIVPKKAFGQNFLVNPQVIQKILSEVRRHEFEELIEIGPGAGALTEPMLALGLRPHLIELDEDLIEYWQRREMTVTAHDALTLDWTRLHLPAPSLLVSNLPYQISTSIVIERCLGPESIRWMVLMFQKEVAQRLMSETRSKEYGMLSVMAQLHFKMKKVADCAPKDFFPAPKVASRVLAFERLPVEGLGLPFLRFVKAAFAFRRKFLLKNLGGVVDKAKVLRAFEEMGLSDKARAEELSPRQFAELFKKVYEH